MAFNLDLTESNYDFYKNIPRGFHTQKKKTKLLTHIWTRKNTKTNKTHHPKARNVFLVQF